MYAYHVRVLVCVHRLEGRYVTFIMMCFNYCCAEVGKVGD